MDNIELLRIIKNFKDRYAAKETTETLQFYQTMNKDQAELTNAENLLLRGIGAYQKNDDYETAIKYISDSLNIVSSNDAYYNRGVIHWCEKKYFLSFKDHCAALILHKENHIHSYYYLGHSLLQLIDDRDESNVTSINHYIKIIDFIIEILSSGHERNEANATQLLTEVKIFRSSLEN